MISAWQEHGNAIDFVKTRGDDVDYKQLVCMCQLRSYDHCLDALARDRRSKGSLLEFGSSTLLLRARLYMES